MITDNKNTIIAQWDIDKLYLRLIAAGISPIANDKRETIESMVSTLIDKYTLLNKDMQSITVTVNDLLHGDQNINTLADRFSSLMDILSKYER